MDSGEERCQSWPEKLDHISQDSMRELGNVGWQRLWHRGVPKKGIERKENSTGLKSGHEGERMESLAWLWVTKSACPVGWEGRELIGLCPHCYPM